MCVCLDNHGLFNCSRQEGGRGVQEGAGEGEVQVQVQVQERERVMAYKLVGQLQEPVSISWTKQV